MLRINTQDAKTRLSALLASVEESGEPILICRNGRPIAELRPVGALRDPLVPHPELSAVVFHADPMEGVDEEDWPEAF